MKKLIRRFNSPIVLILFGLLLGALLTLGVQHRHEGKMKLKHLAALLFMPATVLTVAGTAQAQYSQNFDSTSVGTLPTGFVNADGGGWTVTAGSTVSSPNDIAPNPDSNGPTVLYTGASVADEAVQGTIIWTANNAVPLLRSSADGRTAYAIYIIGHNLYFYKLPDVAQIGSTVSAPWPSFVDGDKVVLKVQVQGTTLSVKAWDLTKGQTEPASYQYTQSDSSITAAGYVGFRAQGSGDQVDDFSYGAPNTVLGGSTSAPAPTITIAPTSARVSPYTWNAGGGGLMTVDAGAYLGISLSYTSAGPLSLGLTTTNYSSIPAASRPILTYSLDNGPRQDVQLSDANLVGTAPNQSLAIAPNLATGTHTLTVWYKALSLAYDLWTPTNYVAITGYIVPTGTTASAAVQRPKRLLALGDSITQAYNVNGEGQDDALRATPLLVANALNAEYGQVGFGGLGWTTANAFGFVPGFVTSWPYYYNGASRLTNGLLTPAPDYVLVNMGTNGNTTGTLATSGSTGDARGNMAAVRAASGAASLNIYLVPFGQYARAGLLNDLSFYGGGTTGSNGYTSTAYPTGALGTATVYRAISDPKTWVLDLGTGAATGLTGAASFQAPVDGVHPSALTNAVLANAISSVIQQATATTTMTRLPNRRFQ